MRFLEHPLAKTLRIPWAVVPILILKLRWLEAVTALVYITGTL
jgi:hypothetical protein